MGICVREKEYIQSTHVLIMVTNDDLRNTHDLVSPYRALHGHEESCISPLLSTAFLLSRLYPARMDEGAKPLSTSLCTLSSAAYVPLSNELDRNKWPL